MIDLNPVVADDDQESTSAVDPPPPRRKCFADVARDRGNALRRSAHGEVERAGSVRTRVVSTTSIVFHRNANVTTCTQRGEEIRTRSVRTV